MRLDTGKEQDNWQFNWKQHGGAALAILAIVAAGWYVWGQYRKTTGGLAATQLEQRAQRAPQQRQGPSPEQRRQMFATILKEVGVTPEQQQKIDQLPQDDWRKRREEMDKILTPEQHEKMREVMRAHAEERFKEMTKNMTDADREALRKRMEERRNRGGGPGGRRGRTPDGGGGGGGDRAQ